MSIKPANHSVQQFLLSTTCPQAQMHHRWWLSLLLSSAIVAIAECRRSLEACNSCKRTLREAPKKASCAVRETCIRCTETKIKYGQSIDGCASATISCGRIDMPRVRLIADNSANFIDVPISNTIVLKCTGNSSWIYEEANASYSVVRAVCFGHAANSQESPIVISRGKTVTSDAHDARFFAAEYGNDIMSNMHFQKGASNAEGFKVFVNQSLKPSLRVSHLSEPVVLEQFHMHWGSERGGGGSEHVIDNVHFDGEMHFVHYSPKYGSFEHAFGQEGGVAVVAVLVQVDDDDDNAAFTPITDAVERFLVTGVESDVIHEGSFRTMNPASLFPDNHEYFAYTGSLTTPLYQTCVAWIVMTSPVRISKRQISLLRQLTPANFRDAKSIRVEKDTTVYRTAGVKVTSGGGISFPHRIIDTFTNIIPRLFQG